MVRCGYWVLVDCVSLRMLEYLVTDKMRGRVHISSYHLMQFLELRQKSKFRTLIFLSNFCMIFMNSYIDEVKVRNLVKNV